MATLKDVISAVEHIAPPRLAMDGDPIGLHYGRLDRRIRRVAMALDASIDMQKAALSGRADLLLVHHPRFWGGLKTLRADDASGARAAFMAEHRLPVYSAHTNLDAAPGGVNDTLAETVGLQSPEIVEAHRVERLIKLAVFVPASHVEKIRKALCAAGAGAIGKYADCTFRVRGVGTFSCGEGTKPFQGTPGSFEEADEFRLETIFGEYDQDRILAALLKAHPYEEAAYDLYPVLGQGRRYGFGRVGRLPRRETVADLAARLAQAVGSSMVQYSGRPRRPLTRVAVWAGAGANVQALSTCGAEAVVAGEVSYHDVETFMDRGIAVITLGHGHSEEIVLKPWAARLRKLVPGVEFKVLPRGGISMTNV